MVDMKTPKKVIIGLLTVTALAGSYTITQVAADTNTTPLYTTNQTEKNTVAETEEVSTEEVATETETTEESVSEESDVTVDSTVDTNEAEAVTEDAEPSSKATSEEAVVEETPTASSEESTSAQETEAVSETPVTSESEEAVEPTEPAAETATVADQTENRQIIIERNELPADALDAYSDEQIAQSRVEAENLGSDPGWSYHWLQQQTPAFADAQSI